jgi:hypothetical protein
MYSKYSNIILLILPQVEIKIYDLIENLEKRQIKISKYVLLVSFSFIILPLKYILERTYSSITNILLLPMYILITKRGIGVLLGIFIFTDIIQYLKSNYGIIIYLYIIIICYIILSVMYLIQMLVNNYSINRLQYGPYSLWHTRNIWKKRERISILHIIIIKMWKQEVVDHDYFLLKKKVIFNMQ